MTVSDRDDDEYAIASYDEYAIASYEARRWSGLAITFAALGALTFPIEPLGSIFGAVALVMAMWARRSAQAAGLSPSSISLIAFLIGVALLVVWLARTVLPLVLLAIHGVLA